MASPYVATKVTKKASAERLLCRTMPLPRKSDRTTGCNYLPRFAHARPSASAKLAMPLQSHRPPSFCLLSPEAYLLTGKIRTEKLFPPLLSAAGEERDVKRSVDRVGRKQHSIHTNSTKYADNFSYIYINKQPACLFWR
jgi:hypothetical protein